MAAQSGRCVDIAFMSLDYCNRHRVMLLVTSFVNVLAL